jgi:hydroxymethylglutaryl-CoA lyase
MVDEVRAVAAPLAERSPQVGLEIGLPTAFGRTLQGRAEEDEVVNLAEQRVAAGADDCGLSHTTGMANTAQWRRLSTRLRAALGERARRVGQCDHRGPGVHVRGHGRGHRSEPARAVCRP